MEEEILMIVLVVVALFLIPFIFYLITLQNTLKAVRIENRTMPPGQVWLLLIPLFSLVWNFFVVNRVADSLANEYASRGLTPEEIRPGYNVGLAMAILQVCGLIPVLGGFAGLGALICWIIYWVKVAGYKNGLGTLSGTLDERI
ncbi:MAG: hypothetical protein ACKVOR_01365 [Flavobacteriales bacterium]